MQNAMKNWKTSAAGALMVLSGIGAMFGVKTGIDPSAAVATIMGGIGLIFAKDGNVSGT
ncbi:MULTISPECIES: hypothetical protein [unclassified Bradyrhizobium]|uniref:hypothetical protein n=1 Tax=unclassified Bradyrhizobium TaxID=2631580 RepID=UPI0029161CEA|nr:MULTISPECIES: hypothetical protein [unclassified Bradyrhizobium]